MGAYLRKSRKEINEDIEKGVELFPKFKERMSQMAGTLSGGEQQMLALIRGLMACPKLLMLDEPSMGLAPIIVDQIYEAITQINKTGMTILLVEQNTNMALQAADYAYILSVGGIVTEGRASDLSADEDLIRSYFKGHHAEEETRG